MDSEHCHACGVKNANLIGDGSTSTYERHYRMSHEERAEERAGKEPILYGYLCMKCRKVLNASDENIKRLRDVANYVERTRNEAVRCKFCSKVLPTSESTRKRQYCNDAHKMRYYRNVKRNAMVAQ